MILEYRKAPINYINGIPSHLAGEWPGLKPSKFHSYRKVIRPLSSGIIFNETSQLILPKRAGYQPFKPSPELIFKPCCKIFPKKQQPQEYKEKIEGIKKFQPIFRPIINRPEKRHKFPYKDEIINKENERLKSATMREIVNEEIKRANSAFGFRKGEFSLKIKYNNTFQRNFNFNEDNIDYINESLLTERDIKILNKKKKIRDIFNLNNDINYVKNLINWDKKYFPKIKSRNTNLTNIEQSNLAETKETKESNTIA